MDGSLNDDITLMILNESEENQKEAEDFLNNYLQPSFPEIEQEVKTRKASFNILLNFKRNYELIQKLLIDINKLGNWMQASLQCSPI